MLVIAPGKVMGTRRLLQRVVDDPHEGPARGNVAQQKHHILGLVPLIGEPAGARRPALERLCARARAERGDWPAAVPCPSDRPPSLLNGPRC